MEDIVERYMENVSEMARLPEQLQQRIQRLHELEIQIRKMLDSIERIKMICYKITGEDANERIEKHYIQIKLLHKKVREIDAEKAEISDETLKMVKKHERKVNADLKAEQRRKRGQERAVSRNQPDDGAMSSPPTLSPEPDEGPVLAEGPSEVEVMRGPEREDQSMMLSPGPNLSLRGKEVGLESVSPGKVQLENPSVDKPKSRLVYNYAANHLTTLAPRKKSKDLGTSRVTRTIKAGCQPRKKAETRSQPKLKLPPPTNQTPKRNVKPVRKSDEGKAKLLKTFNSKGNRSGKTSSSRTSSSSSNKSGSKKKVYCFCRKGEQGFMIACDKCDEWYHGDCIGINQENAPKGKWNCYKCQPSGKKPKFFLPAKFN